MNSNQKMIVVGCLGTSHGVSGWMKITSYTDPDTNLLDYNPWYFKTHGVYTPIKVVEKRIQDPYLVAKLEGCDSREVAKTWTGREISVPRSALPPCNDNEFYWSDLEGLQVLDSTGNVLGTLENLMATGSNDVMLLSGEKTLQIPFIMHEVVKNVDLIKALLPLIGNMNKTLWAGIVSIFPDMFNALNYGMPAKAISQQQLDIALFNPRDFTDNKHQTVDDRPFGGGPGMVMMVEPLKKALNAAKKASPFAPKVIYLSPTGKRFDHNAALELAKAQALVFVAGRYEGIDQRFIDTMIDEEWSVGDYVTSGGELPIMIMIDTIIRQLPGVLGHEQSAECDSFANGLLDCPHYTRPEMIEGMPIPEVLKSGNHQAIANWRLKQSLGLTWLKRPDLLAKRALTEQEQQLLTEFKLDFRLRGNDENNGAKP